MPKNSAGLVPGIAPRAIGCPCWGLGWHGGSLVVRAGAWDGMEGHRLPKLGLGTALEWLTMLELRCILQSRLKGKGSGGPGWAEQHSWGQNWPWWSRWGAHGVQPWFGVAQGRKRTGHKLRGHHRSIPGGGFQLQQGSPGYSTGFLEVTWTLPALKPGTPQGPSLVGTSAGWPWGWGRM